MGFNTDEHNPAPPGRFMLSSYIPNTDRLSPPQISLPAAGTHRNGITIIDSADEPVEYTGPQERPHSFVSAYVMHCLNLPATLSAYSAPGLPSQVQIMFTLEF